MALRYDIEVWAKQNLHSVEDYYEVFKGLQDAVDRQIFSGDVYGDYVFRHTAKALDKTAKQQDLKRNPQTKLKAKLLK